MNAAATAQTVHVGTPVTSPPSVLVTDANDNPVAGVAVTFAVGLGSGTITGANATTDAAGIATVGSWTLGTDRRDQHADGRREPASPARR